MPALPPTTTVGSLSITVPDLGRALPFYTQVIGLRLQTREGDRASLGASAGAPLLELVEQPDARAVRGATGLYHFAILTPSRLALARSLRRLIETGAPLQGFADHRVSEAIYLADPDGNGIEIYRDRPRSEWQTPDGRLRMGTDPLDVDGVLAELAGHPEPWSGLHPATTLGHMHLHVADLRAAQAFYCDVLGFDLVMRYGPSAAFVSAGGYHHHIGLNTWAGVGAPPPPPDAVGLRWFTVRLPDEASHEEVADRVRAAGLPLEAHPQGLMVRDPSRNGVMLATG